MFIVSCCNFGFTIPGNGFFLYSSESLKKAKQAQCGLIEIDPADGDNETIEGQIPKPEINHFNPSQYEGNDETEYIIITSLWYWW